MTRKTIRKHTKGPWYYDTMTRGIWRKKTMIAELNVCAEFVSNNHQADGNLIASSPHLFNMVTDGSQCLNWHDFLEWQSKAQQLLESIKRGDYVE